MDILAQSALLVAVASFALGVSVLARNVRNKLYLSFAGLCALIAAWAFSFFLDKIWGTGDIASIGFYRFHLFLNLWLAPVALVFIRVMVRTQDSIGRRLIDLAVIVSISLTVALFFHMDSIPWVLQLMYFAPFFVVLQTLELMWIDRRLKRGLTLNPKLPTVGLRRRNLIYLGALVVLSTSVMDHVPWMGKVIPSIGNVVLCIYLYFLSQAITQQRLLNIRALFSRFLVLLFFALMLTGVYALLVAWVEGNPGLFFLNSFIASFLLLMLLDPMRALVGYFTERLLTKTHLRLQLTLREARLRLGTIAEPAALFDAILSAAEQVLEPQSASLFVLRRDGVKLRRVLSVGDRRDPDEPQQLSELVADHPLIEHCRKLEKRGELPVILDQMLEAERDRSASRVQREGLVTLLEGLKALNANLLIPLIDGERVLGIVTLHVPAPPAPWGSNWGLLPVAYPYFEQAAQAMRNVGLYVRQREKERLAELGEMSAGLAHEIRNPLGAIKGAAQFLDPSADRADSRFLKIIVEEVDRLNRVVTQFLEYSKPSSLELKTIDVGALVEKALECLRPGLRAGVTVGFSRPAATAWVSAAPEQIQQVLLNLVQNSAKALEGRESARVEVSVESSGPEVHIIVEDNGSGIRKEHLDKLFIPFFTTSPSGTGLGLPICQKIVEAHRGRIEVQSELGRFARFSVILPAVAQRGEIAYDA